MATIEKTAPETAEITAEQEIAALVARSRAAQAQIENYTQEQVDRLIRGMVWAVAKPETAEYLAQHTVDETQRALIVVGSGYRSARPELEVNADVAAALLLRAKIWIRAQTRSIDIDTECRRPNPLSI